MDPKISIWIIKSLLILTLLYLAYVDWRTFRLPNAITFPLIIFGISFNWISDLRFVSLPCAVLGAILGYGSLWALNIGYRLLKHRNGIGMGDAKLLAADLCAREGFFVASILEEVGLRPEVHLLTDRAGTLESTMCQPGVRELWIQEAVREHRLEVFYVPGQINVADALTKALPRERFEQLMSVLGVRGFSSTVR